MDEKELVFGEIAFTASTLGSLFEPVSQTLFIADCHFGKASHFRKHNIPVPQNAAVADYYNLIALLDYYKPQLCIFMGDLFHSASNSEWKWLSALRKEYTGIRFLLIEGNHDILPSVHYQEAGFEVLPELLFQNRILLTHEPAENRPIYNMCGHIHPGFTLRGKARQALSMPCFYIHGQLLILPAFGTLTGHVNMDRHLPGGNALCIAGKKLVWVENSA